MLSVLPQSPPSDDKISTFATRFWAGRTYFGAKDKGIPCGALDAFESWQDLMCAGPLYHSESKMFHGGKWGVVWIVRGLLVLLANLGAATKIVQAPIPAPNEYELDRASKANFKRIVKWCRQWLELLTKSLDKLKATSHER